MRSRIAVVLTIFALAACGEPPPETSDAGTPDAGRPDSGTPDSGTPDAGRPDSGTPDSGTPDSGTPDSGTPDNTPKCVELPSDWAGDGLVWGSALSEEVLAVAINSQGNLYVAEVSFTMRGRREEPQHIYKGFRRLKKV
jgi:hypothetical protein